MATPQLVIGNKSLSSWSLRAWLILRKAGIQFDEVLIELFDGHFKEKIQAYSSSGKVPIYIDNGVTIWDTLAIAEYIAEANPELWPSEKVDRAYARSVSAEMHSGFQTIRSQMPMDCLTTGLSVADSSELTAEIERIQQIWTDCRKLHADKGPWLFGEFSIADAMFAPVATRFNSYGISCPELADQYIQTILADKDMLQWFEHS